MHGYGLSPTVADLRVTLAFGPCEINEVEPRLADVCDGAILLQRFDADGKDRVAAATFPVHRRGSHAAVAPANFQDLAGLIGVLDRQLLQVADKHAPLDVLANGQTIGAGIQQVKNRLVVDF